MCVYIASKYTKDRFDLNPGSDLVKKKPEVFWALECYMLMRERTPHWLKGSIIGAILYAILILPWQNDSENDEQKAKSVVLKISYTSELCIGPLPSTNQHFSIASDRKYFVVMLSFFGLWIYGKHEIWSSAWPIGLKIWKWSLCSLPARQFWAGYSPALVLTSLDQSQGHLD